MSHSVTEESFVDDILDETGDFLTLDMFKNKYDVNVDFLYFYGIINAISKDMRNKIQVKKNENHLKPFIPSNLKLFYNCKKGSKSLYEILMDSPVEPTGKLKWNNIHFFSSAEWTHIFSLPFNISNNPKFQWLQFRINHNILTTNTFLFKIGLSDSPLCTFCNNDNETILHLLWECNETEKLLLQFKRICYQNDHIISLDKIQFVFGDLNKSKQSESFNVVMLDIESYVYR